MNRAYKNANRWLAIFTLSVFFSCMSPNAISAQPQRKSNLREQFHFDLEGPVVVPATIPDGVLLVLRTDPTVLSSVCPKPTQLSDHAFALLFEASSIHLNGSERLDLIVKAHDPCLFGANIGPFWVFRKVPDGYKLVLSVSALGMEVLENKSHNYRDLKVGAIAAGKVVNVTYKFNGNNYKEAGSKVEEIH
jgi:hypothetical protein